jgi:hypothetical protein
MKHIILIGEDIVLPFGIFSPNDAWHCSLHFFLPCVCDAEQFQVALVVQVTTLGLSTRWTGHLMDAMLLYPAEGTSIWHGSLGRSRPTSWYILLCSVIGGFWSLHLHICIFLFQKKHICICMQPFWQPHNRAVARRIQNMGWRADGGLWLLVRGGGLFLSKGTGVRIACVSCHLAKWVSKYPLIFSISWGLLFSLLWTLMVLLPNVTVICFHA